MLQDQYLAAAQQTMQRLHASESALDAKGWRLAVVLIYAMILGTKCSHDVRMGYKKLSPTFTTWFGGGDGSRDSPVVRELQTPPRAGMTRVGK